MKRWGSVGAGFLFFLFFSFPNFRLGSLHQWIHHSPSLQSRSSSRPESWKEGGGKVARPLQTKGWGVTISPIGVITLNPNCTGKYVCMLRMLHGFNCRGKWYCRTWRRDRQLQYDSFLVLFHTSDCKSCEARYCLELRVNRKATMRQRGNDWPRAQ